MNKRYVILGGTGFIGTNLVQELSNDSNAEILVYGNNPAFAKPIRSFGAKCIIANLDNEFNFDAILNETDIVFHMLCSSVPASSNKLISNELGDIKLSATIFDSCIRQQVAQIVYFSSGGAVYGSKVKNPAKETGVLAPVSSYGYQKEAIEELLALYGRIYDIGYKIVRLSNPYGPYQYPGKQGVIASLLNCSISGNVFAMRGDGRSIRDYIFIKDAIKAIMNVTFSSELHSTYNIGSGKGTSLGSLIDKVSKITGLPITVVRTEASISDVDAIWLDTTRYEAEFGSISTVSLDEGIAETFEFLKKSQYG